MFRYIISDIFAEFRIQVLFGTSSCHFDDLHSFKTQEKFEENFQSHENGEMIPENLEGGRLQYWNEELGLNYPKYFKNRQEPILFSIYILVILLCLSFPSIRVSNINISNFTQTNKFSTAQVQEQVPS